MDYALLRNKMVQEQLIQRGIKDKRVLDAFSKVERHRFIADDLRSNAYGDYPVSIGDGQTISQPFIVALMIESLDLKNEDRVLEIGTGSGYQSAILAELVKEVYSIERIASLSRDAQKALDELGYKNIKIKVSDGTLGWQEESPFDKIIVSAATDRIPLPLTQQLKENGKMVLPLGESFSQELILIEKRQDKLISEKICNCVFVPLIGEFGRRPG